MLQPCLHTWRLQLNIILHSRLPHPTIRTTEVEVEVPTEAEEAIQVEVEGSLNTKRTHRVKEIDRFVKSVVDQDTLPSSATTDLTTTTNLNKPSLPYVLQTTTNGSQTQERLHMLLLRPRTSRTPTPTKEMTP